MFPPLWSAAEARTIRDAAAQKLSREPGAPGSVGYKGVPSSLHVSGSGCTGVLTGVRHVLFSIVDAAWTPRFT